MEKIKIKTRYKTMLADTITPVSIYLNIRNKYKKSFLLESSDYHGNEDSYSFICFNPVASFKVEDEKIFTVYPNGDFETKSTQEHDVVEELNTFAGLFESEELGFDFVTNGLFGFTSFEGVQHFEDIDFDYLEKEGKKVPDMHYMVFQNIISINHFKNELYLFEHRTEIGTGSGPESLEKLEELVKSPNVSKNTFQREGEELSNCTNEEFLKMVQSAKKHCKRGDVFQLVLSREFSQKFQGDEFTLYRALRSINPSPYLFYFDFEKFRIFGSSPEAQIVIKNRKATIYPIAGTFRRTGDDVKDAELAKKLLDDPKENAEHVMLVDLARNDLSRDSKGVSVEAYREIQFYSHVIHLVSKVTGDLLPDKNSIRLVADTFPAGTLSGAPKHMALQLINKYEKNQRGIYGGCIGFLGFNGDFNHAIIIRSFLSKNNNLYYQAGAGIVMKSDDESERQEVFNKLAALHKAIELAEQL
ncbi:MAG: anthranilate synthase component I [Flavobacteriales bacterium]|nr:anthranilate synthase component I [Flavobacteriales bacterium]|tara:strand:- start:10337 stop:11752 length:1416 start_codon:yes stop_codon:yes gene_type:complete